MRLIDADALTEFLKCLLPERGMWEIEGDTGKNAVCETVAEAIEMVKNMETIQPEKAQLSQEGTTKDATSDTVSRQAAIDIVVFECGKWTGLAKEISKQLRQLPPAQPGRKMGRWIPDNRPGGGFWVCSCCKFPSEAFAANVLYKFCPNCGAKMRGEQHETD